MGSPLQWLPVILGAHDPVPSAGSRVVTTHDADDVDDGTPHRDLTSHQSAEPTPTEIRSHAPLSSASFDPVRPLPSIPKSREMIAWWTSSALLCALLFLLSAYVFNGKVATHFSPPAHSVHSSSPCVLLTPCTSRHASPSSLSSAPWPPQDRLPKKKGARVLKGKARSPEVRLNSLAPRALAPLSLALATSQPPNPLCRRYDCSCR